MSITYERQWESHGCRCVVVRFPEPMSHRCGYVNIPDTHPWFEKDYDEIRDVEVHGGLTFAEYQLKSDEPKGWWIGFDCAHHGDKSSWNPDGKDWTHDLVVAECDWLARQVEDAA